METHTKWLINKNLTCVDKDNTCSKDKNVYWNCEVDSDGDIVRIADDYQGCKKHLKENGINYKKVNKVIGYMSPFGFVSS